jgi:hypothetical protein
VPDAALPHLATQQPRARWSRATNGSISSLTPTKDVNRPKCRPDIEITFRAGDPHMIGGVDRYNVLGVPPALPGLW